MKASITMKTIAYSNRDIAPLAATIAYSNRDIAPLATTGQQAKRMLDRLFKNFDW